VYVNNNPIVSGLKLFLNIIIKHNKKLLKNKEYNSKVKVNQVELPLRK
jgi:hypothetical protein